MLSATAVSERRAWLRFWIFWVTAALCVGLFGVAAYTGRGANASTSATAAGQPATAASADSTSPTSPTSATSPEMPQGILGGATDGLPESYFTPPALSDTTAPGAVVSSDLGTSTDQGDAFVLTHGGHYYLFTSHGAGSALNLPVRVATTLGHWGPALDALPALPSWTQGGLLWAPDVHRFGDDYVMYFTAPLELNGHRRMCIGDAVSSAATGPYMAAPTPFMCQTWMGGSIDPRTFVDANGTPYLIWKSDNNAAAAYGPARIWSQQLSGDGYHLLGQATQIFGPDVPWQATIVEAPQMVLVRGVYYLFYSANGYWSENYAIGVAHCSGPLGPCSDGATVPLLGTNDEGLGPGEESLFADGTGIYMVYSPWYAAGWPRPVEMAHIGFGPLGPYLASVPDLPASLQPATSSVPTTSTTSSTPNAPTSTPTAPTTPAAPISPTTTIPSAPSAPNTTAPTTGG
jgi:GH43 family beta-xylosidase